MPENTTHTRTAAIPRPPTEKAPSGAAIKTILIAPEYAMTNFGESNRMACFAKAFKEIGHRVVVLGKGRYDDLFESMGCESLHIPFDNEWMTESIYLKMHQCDEYLMDWIEAGDLARFVREEVALLGRLKPDMVLTGFRPSMTLSARLAGVPLTWVHSTVGSDMYYQKGLATMVDGIYGKFPFMRLLPAGFCDRLANFSAMRVPLKMGVWNKVAKQSGLPKFKSVPELARGDFNLLPDAPELFPEFGELPPYYAFCGPFIVEKALAMPDSVKAYQKRRPMVFFSMGSSGDPRLFSAIIQSFEGKPYDVFAASTSIIEKFALGRIPSNVIVEPFFPAMEMASMADVTVTHGGQGTVYTSAMAGAPFVGLPMFSEQQFNLENLSRKGSGIVLKRYRFTPSQVDESIRKILADGAYKDKATELKNALAKYRDPEYLPSRVGAGKILAFLDTPQHSYFRRG